MKRPEMPFAPQKILLPTDLSAGSKIAMRVGFDLANRYDAQVDVLTVIQDLPEDLYGDMDYFNDEIAGRLREQIHAALNNMELKPGVRQTTRLHIRKGDPADEIIRTAKKGFNDLTVMATHGRVGLNRLTYGSVTEDVAIQGRAPLLAVKPSRGRDSFDCKTILVPVDFSERDHVALCHAAAMKASLKAKVVVQHVIPLPSVEALGLVAPKAAHSRARARIQKAMDVVGLKGRILVGEGQPVSEILDSFNKLNADLILVPARQKKGVLGSLGSVSARLVRRAPGDVWVIRS